MILFAAPGEQYCVSDTQYATCVAGTGGACPQWDMSGNCQSLFPTAQCISFPDGTFADCVGNPEF